MKKIIACAHPGKMGDALYSLPSIRALCAKHEARCDFYTSDYCLPMRSLFEAQSCIRQVIVPAAYEVKSMDCGCQPWEMPIDPRGYEAVYQMGFRGCPQGFLGSFIAQSVGLPPEAGLDVRYELGNALAGPLMRQIILEEIPKRYVVIASRGETSYADRFRAFAERCPIKCVEVGALGQRVIPAAVDLTYLSMADMAHIISQAVAFVGLMSGPLVIANGWGMPKIVPHNGVNWDMSHVLYTPQHHYLVEPTVEQMLALIPN